jgi:Arc/MetJ-type ribon-helix-helix transcriptional regulator
MASFRAPPEMMDRLDAWIATQPEPRPTRSEAIRSLIDGALGAAEAKARNKSTKARKAAAVKSPPPSDAFLRAKSRGRR